jgi:hypothetical protein
VDAVVVGAGMVAGLGAGSGVDAVAGVAVGTGMVAGLAVGSGVGVVTAVGSDDAVGDSAGFVLDEPSPGAGESAPPASGGLGLSAMPDPP